jgi:hypothetical protein
MENRGTNLSLRDRTVPRKFGVVAKVLWRKPAAHIAAIAKCSERNAKRILRGDADVPAEVLLAAISEMLRPQAEPSTS